MNLSILSQSQNLTKLTKFESASTQVCWKKQKRNLWQDLLHFGMQTMATSNLISDDKHPDDRI